MEVMEVRKARPDDAEVITAFQIAMALESENLRLHPATVAQGVAAVFADPHKGTYWVAEEQREVLASLLVIPEWSDWRNGTALWIHSVYVRPEHRNKGVYRRMYQRLLDEAQNVPGITALRLYVDKRNATAQAVYRRLGMSAEHYDLYEWVPK